MKPRNENDIDYYFRELNRTNVYTLDDEGDIETFYSYLCIDPGYNITDNSNTFLQSVTGYVNSANVGNYYIKYTNI